MWRWISAVLALCALLGPAGAQTTTPEDTSDQRYVFHEVDDGILRLDTRLGEISLCSRQNVGWTCRTVPDERNALDSELARLQQENAELKNALTAHSEREAAQANGAKPAPQAPAKEEPPKQEAAKPEAAKPAEPVARPHGGDLARARAIVGMIWQRLVEMMANLRADMAKNG